MVTVPGQTHPRALEGRVVVVTGGNRGIGLGMARGCARAGASVAVWSRDPERNARAVEELSVEGAAHAVRCDVSDEEQVARAMEETLREFGKVDVLFANAGLARSAPFTEMSLDDWRFVLSVNLDGAFLALRAAARHMVERGEGGSLVATSSTSAIHGAPRLQHYAASKAALGAVMRSLAVELARHGIRANSLVVGWTETELNAASRENERFLETTTRRTPVRRWATPDDLEPAAVFLADPTITYHTGTDFVVDGGYTVF